MSHRRDNVTRFVHGDKRDAVRRSRSLVMLDKYSIVCSPGIVEANGRQQPWASGTSRNRPPKTLEFVPPKSITTSSPSAPDPRQGHRVSINKLRNVPRSLVDKNRAKKGDDALGHTVGAESNDSDDDTTTISECTTLDESEDDKDNKSPSGSSGSSSSTSLSDDNDEDSLSEYVNELLTDLWDAHMEDDEHQIAHAFQQLAIECGPQRNGPPTRRSVLYAGGHSQILHILAEHRSSNAICRAALGAVMALCVSYSARALVGTSATGIESILAAMRSHPQDAFLQTTACGILVQLVSPPACERDRYTRSTFVRHEDSAAATATTDRQSVAAAELSKAAIVAAGGVAAVLDAMREFAAQSPRLCRYACLLLVRVAKNNAYHRDHLISEGAVQVVSNVLRSYRTANCEAFQQANALRRTLEDEIDNYGASNNSSSRGGANDSSTYFYEV